MRTAGGLLRLMSNSSDQVGPNTQTSTITPYLYLTQIPQGTQAETLYRVLQQHGRVVYFRIAIGPNNAWMGHAFCDYHTKKQAKAFVDATKSNLIVLPGGFTPIHAEYNSASASRFQIAADARYTFDQRESIPPHRKLVVRHIPWATRTNTLKDFFSKWGKIQRVFHRADDLRHRPRRPTKLQDMQNITDFWK
ncbi:hypothetical protein BDZ89DRAFT_1077137 [Hymenopellis radicata]|nr:hypothetical protein BDZ89DRAFT_1077137 [Hymenopellis radicata]